MMNRRQVLKSLPVAAAAGALLAVSGRTLAAEVPAMDLRNAQDLSG